jgi:hypothetical protein
MKNTEASLEHTAAADQLAARKELLRLFKKTPLSDDDLLFNLGLYVRSGLLAKFLLLADIYKRIVNVPGLLVEYGTWFGQNLVLLENLRAIYEPFAKQRRIVAFDTFDGYREGKYENTGLYNTGPKYVSYLDKLLKTHQGANVYGHQKISHELIEGDVCCTASSYFAAHPEAIVAFVFLDMGPYRPTYEALKAVKPHLVPGSVLLLDELTLPDEPGEAIAFKEVFEGSRYRIEKIAIYPSKTVVTIE